MWRFALTFWFTVTTLLGPGVCCCSFASATPTDTGGRSSTTAAKSCCDQSTPPCGSDGKHHQEPGKPSKCPCEKGKQVNTLPPADTTTTHFAAQLKLIDSLFFGLLLPYLLDLGTITGATSDTSQPVVRLAGRDLLAAYSILRC
ncbi:unnamed protein product [Gemmataceae bacterium]|jgi:hypothetical protein|nr:unnamed protein product [Gemmataceae bacterium]VTU01701.1 unnamed protein product [Gemmataceae bacterium]